MNEPGPDRQIVVIGGGGHARVVIEILLVAGWQVVGFTDARQHSENWCSVPCLGGDFELPRVRAAGVSQAIVAVGENALRGRLAGEAAAAGFALANAVHPGAWLSPTVSLGRGIAIMAGAVLNAGVVVGDNVIVNTGATVDHDCRLGAQVHVAPGCHLAGSVVVEEGALIGVGAVVGRGRPLVIGARAVVGSGSVVIGDVPAGATVVGNPARPLGAS
ncbi:MAG TPA: acetyltransferase [Thermoanaerobaculia bacterium]|nr:acetyltransferase [Thermoanaerobaculia bacterium]